MQDKNKITEYLKKSKTSIAIIVFFLLLAFGERLISTSFSIDTELYLNSDDGSAIWWIALNRWALVFINKILSLVKLVIYQSNFLTVFFMLVYSVLLCYLFYLHIPKKWEKTYLKYQFIFPIIFITNPIFAEQYNFINQNVGVSLGICLSTLSVILFNYADKLKGTKHYLLIVMSSLIAAFSFGIYQSIVPLYILIIASTYLLECLKNNNSSWKYLLNNILRFILIFIIYFIISKLVGGGKNSYLASAWSTTGIGCLKNIYYVIVEMLKCNGIFYNIGYPVTIVLLIAMNIYLLIKKRNNLGTIISSFGIIIAPIYIMIITGVDQLKRTQFNYSFVIGFIILLFIIFIIEHKKLKYLGYLLIIFALGLAYRQSNITGKLFASDNVRFKTDTILATKIQNDIEHKDWYDKNKEYTLVLLGKQECNSSILYLKGEVIGHSFFEFDYRYIYGPNQRANAFLQTLGYDYKMPNVEEFEKAKEFVKEKDLASYPKDDYIQKLENDTIIVRLSEEI